MNSPKIKLLLDLLQENLVNVLRDFKFEVSLTKDNLTITAISNVNQGVKIPVLEVKNTDEGFYITRKICEFNEVQKVKLHSYIKRLFEINNRYPTSEEILFLNEAKKTAQKSVAKRNKVGALLVSSYTGYPVVRGYNSMHPNYPSECEYEKNGKLISYKEVFHAELRVIGEAAKLGIPTKNATLYVTTSPCINCALAIVAAGIKEVIYIEEYRDTSGLELLNNCGVKTYQVFEEQLK